jgi:hypothetical protein
MFEGRKLRRHGVIAGLLGCALLGCTLAGCGEDQAPSSAWHESWEVKEALVVGGDMIFVHETFEQVLRLRPTRDGDAIGLEIDRASTGADPGVRALSADRTQLYVVNEQHGEQDATLSVFDLSSESLEAETVALDSAYDRLSIDPAGDFLLLSFTGSSGDFVARNLNELGIVDLRDGIGEDESATFETLSSRARGIEFAPPFELGGQPQRLAAALSPSEVTIIDLLAEDGPNRLREVPLTISQADQVRTPVQAIFDVTSNIDGTEDTENGLPESVSLYLLTDTGEDITRVTIQPSIRPQSARKFDLSVNQLAAGSDPVQMELLDLGEQGTRLVAIDGSTPRFTVIDVQTGESATFELPMTAPATDLLVYEFIDESGGEPVSETRVLAWSRRSNLAAVIRPESIAISDDAPTLGRSVEAIRLQAAPISVELDEDSAGRRAIVRYEGLGAGFTVLNLAANRVVPIQGASLGDIYFGDNYAYGVFRGQPYFGVFDLATGHPTAYELPREGERIYVDEADELIVVQHGDPTGSFTVLNALTPTREHAVVFNDVFLQDLFTQELP